MNSLYKEQIKKVVIPQFKKEFSLKNDQEVPCITKVIINTGIGRQMNKAQNKKELVEKISQELKRMGDFIYKFINVVLPRIRDFWGIPLKNIDAQGNLNYGIKEHLVFPELSKREKSFSMGMEISFVTNTKNKEKAIKMFRLLGFPLKVKESENK